MKLIKWCPLRFKKHQYETVYADRSVSSEKCVNCDTLRVMTFADATTGAYRG